MLALGVKKRILEAFVSAIIILTFFISIPNGWAADNNDFLSFEELPELRNDELDQMRGGFVTSNGMVLDFSFSANTIVNGELINQVVLNTIEQSISGNSLHNIIQIGEGNVAFKGSVDVDNLPNVLNVVQNNLDDLTIQHVNLFDLSVKNMDNFVQQAVSPEIDFQNSINFTP